MDKVARDRKEADFGSSGEPLHCLSELVDDSDWWAIVAAILLDGPDPPAGPDRRHEALRLATARTRERNSSNKPSA